MIGNTVMMLTRTESRGGKQLWGKSNELDFGYIGFGVEYQLEFPKQKAINADVEPVGKYQG